MNGPRCDLPGTSHRDAARPPKSTVLPWVRWLKGRFGGRSWLRHGLSWGPVAGVGMAWVLALRTVSAASPLPFAAYAPDRASFAADGSGRLHVAFHADGSFRGTAGVHKPTSSAGGWVVGRLNPTLTGFDWATFVGPGDGVGGGAFDLRIVAVDEQGRAVLSGSASPQDFPATGGAHVEPGSGRYVCKLRSDGSALVFNAFVGVIEGPVAVDPSGNVYLAGRAADGMTTTAGAYQTTPSPNATGASEFDQGAQRYDGATGALGYSTLLHPVEHSRFRGRDEDYTDVGGIAVDAGGRLVVVGGTEAVFFIRKRDGTGAVAGGFQHDIDGGNPTVGPSGQASRAGYALRLNSDGSGMDWFNFLGGRAHDSATAVALDGQGTIHVTGSSTLRNTLSVSQGNDFPGTAGSDLNTPAGEGFYCRIAADGASLLGATFLAIGDPGVGGTRYGSTTTGLSVATDAAGNAYVAGDGRVYGAEEAEEEGWPPVTAGYLSEPVEGLVPPPSGGGVLQAGRAAAFLVRFPPSGRRDFVAGLGSALVGDAGVAVWPASKASTVFVVGLTSDPGFPATSPGPWPAGPRPAKVRDEALGYEYLTRVGYVSLVEAKPVFRISGRLATPAGVPVTNVPVALTGGLSREVLSDRRGRYAFLGLAPGIDVVVTPGGQALTFDPEKRSYAGIGSSDFLADFSLVAWTISGRVTRPDGLPAAGVDVVLSGAVSARVKTGALGTYEFKDLGARKDYGIRIDSPGLASEPGERLFPKLDRNQSGVDFVVRAVPSAVSGRVTRDGAGVAGVTISVQGGGAGRQALTDGAGAYRVEGLEGGTSYKVSAVRRGLDFEPAVAELNPIQGETRVDFVGIAEAEPTLLPAPELHPPGSALEVGPLRITAGAIEKVGSLRNPEDGLYRLTGGAAVNDFLLLDGADLLIKVRRQQLRVDVDLKSGSVAMVGIPVFGRLTLYEGASWSGSIDASGIIGDVVRDAALTSLRLAGVDVDMTGGFLTFQPGLNGVDIGSLRIKGTLRFPSLGGIPGFSTEVSDLELDRVGGVQFRSDLSITNLAFAGMELKDVKLKWLGGFTPERASFEGQGTLKTPAFEVGARVKVIGGAMDTVGATVAGFSVPLMAPPVVVMTGGSIEVAGLVEPPVRVTMKGTFTTGNEAVQEVVRIQEAGFEYTMPNSLAGLGTLALLQQPVADARLGIRFPERFAIGGGVRVTEAFPVLVGEANLAVGGRYRSPGPGVDFYIEGDAHGKIQIPDGTGMVYDFAKRVGLVFPVEIAEGNFTLRNNVFQGSFEVDFLGRVSVLVSATQQTVGGNFLGREFQVGNGPGRRGAALAGPSSLLGTTVVTPGTSKLVIRVASFSGPVQFHLHAPGGERIVFGAAGSATFLPDDAQNLAWCVVDQPAAGTWGVEAVPEGGPYVVEVWGGNNPPAITSLTAAPAGSKILVQYSMADPDDDAVLALLAESLDEPGMPIVIREGLPESASGGVTWDPLAGALPAGDYRISAVATDPFNGAVRREAASTVSVVDPLAPAPPRNVKAAGDENSIAVSWDAVNLAGDGGYEVRFGIDRGPATVLDQRLNPGRATAVRLARLQPQATYRIAVVSHHLVATADPGNAGGSIAVAHFSLPSPAVLASTTTARPPVVRVLAPNGGERPLSQGRLEVRWEVSEGGDVVRQALELSEDSGSTWLPVVRNLAGGVRRFLWNAPAVPSSQQLRFRVSAIDAAGNVGQDSSDGDFGLVLDSDGDGIPDAWESANGLNPGDIADGLRDLDGDGVVNRAEFVAGTDPRVAEVRFRIRSFEMSPSGFRLRFRSVAGRKYAVERVFALGATWAPLGPVRDGTGEELEVLDPGGARAAYYRVVER